MSMLYLNRQNMKSLHSFRLLLDISHRILQNNLLLYIYNLELISLYSLLLSINKW